MTTTTIAIIVKTQNEDEAERKAQNVINKICGDSMEDDYDFGVIINSKIKDEPPLLDRFQKAMEKNGYDKPLSGSWANRVYPSFIHISCVTSDDAQRFIKSRLEPEELNYRSGCFDENGYQIGLYDEKGHFIAQRDERGYVTRLQEDSRLHDKDYFVVPCQMHY